MTVLSTNLVKKYQSRADLVRREIKIIKTIAKAIKLCESSNRFIMVALCKTEMRQLKITLTFFSSQLFPSSMNQFSRNFARWCSFIDIGMIAK